MSTIDLIKVEQPIGEFYIGAISAKELVNSIKIEQRSKNTNFFQRDDNPKRVKDITYYCKDPDATFPTPIIIAVDLMDNEDIKFDSSKNILTFNDGGYLGSAIDGQHRLLGLKASDKINNFQLPVVIMFDLDEWEKAYIFATVNSNQKQVQSSLIYDLFDIIETKYRSPQATCHILAKTFNSSENSPFHNRLKMLGKKMDNKQFLSQGTFAKHILDFLISKNPQQDAIKIKNEEMLLEDTSKPLRKYFIQNEDKVIYKILLNYFQALSEVFKNEWENPNNSILTRATGYAAFIRVLVHLLDEAFKTKTITKDFFENKILLFKKYVDFKNIKLDADTYSPSGKTEKDLSLEIIQAMEISQSMVVNEIEIEYDKLYSQWHES